MIFYNEPDDFRSKFEVVSCFLINGNEALFLKRHSNKPQGNTWGIPAGKVEVGEKLNDAILREIKEETGVQVDALRLSFFRTLFVRYSTYDFKYHMYSLDCDVKPEIEIDRASHSESAWFNPKQALKLDLIEDEDKCIKLFFNIDN